MHGVLSLVKSMAASRRSCSDKSTGIPMLNLGAPIMVDRQSLQLWKKSVRTSVSLVDVGVAALVRPGDSSAISDFISSPTMKTFDSGVNLIPRLLRSK